MTEAELKIGSVNVTEWLNAIAQGIAEADPPFLPTPTAHAISDKSVSLCAIERLQTSRTLLRKIQKAASTLFDPESKHIHSAPPWSI